MLTLSTYYAMLQVDDVYQMEVMKWTENWCA